VVRGAAKLPLGRRVLRTDGRNLRGFGTFWSPKPPKKSARENLRRDAWCITGAVSIFVSKQQAAQPHVGDSFPQGPKQKERAIFNGDAYLALPGNPFFYIFLPLKIVVVSCQTFHLGTREFFQMAMGQNPASVRS